MKVTLTFDLGEDNENASDEKFELDMMMKASDLNSALDEFEREVLRPMWKHDCYFDKVVKKVEENLAYRKEHWPEDTITDEDMQGMVIHATVDFIRDRYYECVGDAKMD